MPTEFIPVESGWPPTLHLDDELYVDETIARFDSKPEMDYYMLYAQYGSEIIKIEHDKPVSALNGVRISREIAGTKRRTFHHGTYAFPGYLKEIEE